MPKTRSPNTRLETLRKTAKALRKVGALDKKTMNRIAELCLTKTAPVASDGHKSVSKSDK